MTTTRWSFQPIFESVWLPILMVAILMLLLLVVRPGYRSLTTQRLSTLRWLRLAAIGGLFLAMLRPTIVHTKMKPIPATVAFLLDTSRSMQTKDVAESTRWEAATNLFRSVEPSLHNLAGHYDVRVYGFAGSLSELGRVKDSDSIPLPAEPDGNATDIGESLAALLKQQSDRPLAAVFLVSDGAQRTFETQHDAGQTATRLGNQHCPLYTITLGDPRDRSETRDIAVENFSDEYTVFVKNEIVLTASVFAQGFVGKSLPVELIVKDPRGQIERLGPVTVTPKEGSESHAVQFRYTPSQAGQYELEVSAAAQPGERSVDNNQMKAFLHATEGGLRVLYLCGNIGWQEHNLIRRSIDASFDIQMDFLWIDNRLRANWPIQLGKVIETIDYDVYILADVDMDAIGLAQCQELATEIEKGKGFMMTGGTHSFGPGGYANTTLSGAIPVKLNPFDRQRFDATVREDVHYVSEISLEPTATHFLTQLTPTASLGSASSQSAWSRLPPLHGANRLGTPKDTATVLLESANHDPMLVAGEYGLGRTIAFAGDSTYRWFRYGFKEQHKRFWRQVILWLARKDEAMESDVWLKLNQRRFTAGSQVEFQTGTVNPDGSSDPNTRFEVQLVGPDGIAQGLSVSQGPPSRRGIVRIGKTNSLTTPGTYKLESKAFVNDKLLGQAELPLIVLDQDIELADPTADPGQMAMLASLTEECGGRPLAPEQIPDLLMALQETPVESLNEFESRWRLTDTAIGTWLLFLAITGALGTEWYLRKKWSLV